MQDEYITAYSGISRFLTILFIFFFLLSYIFVNSFLPLIFFIIVSNQIASCALSVTREVHNCRFLTMLYELKFQRNILGADLPHWNRGLRTKVL